MKRKIVLVLAFLLTLSLSFNLALAGKPPKTALDVTISNPPDGHTVEDGGIFSVTGNVVAKRGDAGSVETYVQCAFGEGSTDFTNVDGTYLEIISGGQPHITELLKDELYEVSWTLTGMPGTYEIRIFSQGSTSKDGESNSRTVTILGPPPEPPPTDYETIDLEYQDPETGFGTSSGTYENTYYADGLYEILMEEKNSHGTKNPTDDTADLGWIYIFNNLGTRDDTTFCFSGHLELSGEYLDSGFLEWDDQDTAFYVQEDSTGEWKTIAAITNIGEDRMYSVDVPNDDDTTIRLRIVDNDRGTEGKSPQISSLYVDQAYIVFEPAFEYFIDDISVDLPVNFDAVRIGDIDNDDVNEVYLTYQFDDFTIKYYDYADGVWTETPLAGVNVQGWVQVEDIDSDGWNDLLTMETINDDPSIGYHRYDGAGWTYYKIASVSITHTLVVGDVDNDDENEVLACKDPCDGYELKYYDYVNGDWIEVGLKTWDYAYSGIDIADIDNDSLNEIVWLGYSPEPAIGESALKYFKIVGDGFEEYDILNVDGGRCMDIGDADNDGDIEIALGHYTNPTDENQVRVYDYDIGTASWMEYIVDDVTEALGPICNVKIDDVDNDDLNEIAIGLFDDGSGLANVTIRYYEYETGLGWTEFKVTDTEMTVADLQIGDVDSDGENEILVGLTTWYPDSIVAPELRYYKVNRMCGDA
ncbi:MAG: hypothetical protein ACXABX_02095 [Candidatus Thorarchaeota archaeon]|jgi:hypothetical protein